MAKKLNAPYRLSAAARAAREDMGIEGASGSMGSVAKAMGSRSKSVINTVDEAKDAVADLSEVNKNLRAARRPRRS